MTSIKYIDTYSLGLLYVYINSYERQKMVLVEDLEAFNIMIKKNLKRCDDKYEFKHDNLSSIFFTTTDKKGDLYYVINPNIDFQLAKEKYIDDLPMDILIASQKEETLNTLGLEKDENKIKVKNNNMLLDYIEESSIVMPLIDQNEEEKQISFSDNEDFYKNYIDNEYSKNIKIRKV